MARPSAPDQSNRPPDFKLLKDACNDFCWSALRDVLFHIENDLSRGGYTVPILKPKFKWRRETAKREDYIRLLQACCERDKYCEHLLVRVNGLGEHGWAPKVEFRPQWGRHAHPNGVNGTKKVEKWLRQGIPAELPASGSAMKRERCPVLDSPRKKLVDRKIEAAQPLGRRANGPESGRDRILNSA